MEYFGRIDLGYDEETNDVIVPSFRQDLHRMADLAEEVARFFGYDNIPVHYQTENPQPVRNHSIRVEDVCNVSRTERILWWNDIFLRKSKSIR